MKKHITQALKYVLTGCMVFGVWIPSTSACLLFFGEYEYPNENDYISK